MNQNLLIACSKLLRPLVVLLLRHGVGFSAFSDMVKELYVDVARSDYALPGKKQTASRISTMTGLSRKEVSRMSQLADDLGEAEGLRVNRAARVIGGWVGDKEFLDETGEPMDLEFEGETNSFMALVKRYSGDITARTIADELMRVGAISMTAANRIRLTKKAYVPDSDELQKIHMLGSDVSDLIRTIDHNIKGDMRPLFQRKVEYHHIDLQQSPQVREQLARQAQAHLEALQETIVKNAKVDAKGKGARIGVGIYYFEQDEES